MMSMKVKLCERCNEVEINKINKYCTECRDIVRKEVENRTYRKNGIGIYKITNINNDKSYIGQSVAVNKRLKMHMNQLKKNNHENIYLQRSYNKHGNDAFTYEILEYCSTENLYIRENYWITFYQTHLAKYGYNIVLPSADEVKSSASLELRNRISERNKIYEDEELISYLQEFYYHNGRVITTTELENHPNLPSKRTYDNRFGSFKDALIQADLLDLISDGRLFDITIGYSREELVNKFQKFIDKYGRFPNNEELKQAKKNDIPHYEAILKHFSTTEELKALLGFDKDSLIKQEKDEALKTLFELYERDSVISVKSINECEFTRSATYYVKHFGSFYNACKMANIPEEHRIKENKHTKNGKYKYSLEQLSIEFNRIFDLFLKEKDRFPTRREFEKESKIGLSTFRARLNIEYSKLASHYGYIQ